jgi:hypothetical protein
MSIRVVDGYSSAVSIHLEIDGQQLSVAQIGPDTLILREGVDIEPSSHGILIIDIDGTVEREEIVLPQGCFKNSTQIQYF